MIQQSFNVSSYDNADEIEEAKELAKIEEAQKEEWETNKLFCEIYDSIQETFNSIERIYEEDYTTLQVHGVEFCRDTRLIMESLLDFIYKYKGKY